jgi:hypothetical protein
MSLRAVTLVFFAASVLFSQDSRRVQPGTPKHTPGKTETVEADNNLIVTESKLIAGTAYTPPTVDDRVEWWARRAFAWESLAIGTLSTGVKQWRNSPEEWGKGLDGFGRRYGTREFEVITGNGIEAILGSFWKEDPRYFRSAGDRALKARIIHAVTSSFLTYRYDGTREPAYARFVGTVAAKSMSRTWYPESERVWWKMTVLPLATRLAGRMGSNLLREFRPDLERKFLKKKK